MHSGRSSESVSESPRTSIRHDPQQLDLSTAIVSRIMTNDLALYNTYKDQLCQELKPADYGHHVPRLGSGNHSLGSKFLKKRNVFGRSTLFFYLGGYVNKQNYRIWGLENPREVMQVPKHPSKQVTVVRFRLEVSLGPIALKMTYT